MIEGRQRFLRTQKAITIKITGKLDFIKMEIFFSSKYTVKKIIRLATD